MILALEYRHRDSQELCGVVTSMIFIRVFPLNIIVSGDLSKLQPSGPGGGKFVVSAS